MKKLVSLLLIFSFVGSIIVYSYGIELIKETTTVYSGFSYDDSGVKLNDIQFILDKIIKHEDGSTYIEAQYKDNNETWYFKSISSQEDEDVLFLQGEFSIIEKQKKLQKYTGEIAIIGNLERVAGTINHPKKSFAFIAGNYIPDKDTIRNEYNKLDNITNEKLEKLIVGVTSTEDNIRLEKVTSPEINLHVIGSPRLGTSSNAAWYTVRSFLKNTLYELNFYQIRYNNNYVTPRQYSTGGLTVVDVYPRSASSSYQISFSAGYKAIGVSLTYTAKPASYSGGLSESYVENYNSIGIDKSKVFWPNSWGINNTGVGARFHIKMDGDSQPNQTYLANAKVEWKIWDNLGKIYIVKTENGDFGITAQ